MKLNKQEALLDHLLASPDHPENGAHDEDWIAAAEQLEKQLAEESGLIDKETLIRILSKSISVIRKIQIGNTVRNDLNLEQIVKHRIDDYHYWQGINDALPKTIRSEAARASAKKLHEKTHDKRQTVIEYWRANISVDKSNEFAAEMLQKKFTDLSHRTLAKYVALAKKDLRLLASGNAYEESVPNS